MNNPLDTAAGIAKGGGDLLATGFSSVARFLEQATGSVFAASVFGFFIFLFLSIFKAAAGSKQPLVYARAIRLLIGKLLMASAILYLIWVILAALLLLLFSLSGTNSQVRTLPDFLLAWLELSVPITLGILAPYKWYFAIILAIYIAARVVESVVNTIASVKEGLKAQ